MAGCGVFRHIRAEKLYAPAYLPSPNFLANYFYASPDNICCSIRKEYHDFKIHSKIPIKRNRFLY